MKSLKLILLVVLLSGLATLPTRAQGKIGTVKLRTLFDGYYKTKLADAKIKERASELEKEIDEMAGRYRTLEEEQKNLAASASDLAVSEAERTRRSTAAEGKMIELKQLEQEILKYRRQAEATLREQQTRMRTRVLEEIQTEINAEARSGGYYLVINKDADDRNETPVILFHTGEQDITDAVLGRLNKGAPATLETNAAPAATGQP